MGGQLSRGITLPVIAAGAAIFSVGSTFEHTLSKVVGLTGTARKSVEEWIPKIKEIAVATGVGPERLADALYTITSSGIETGKVLGILEIAAKGAEAGMGDVKDLADVLTGSLAAYAKQGLTAADAMDTLVRAIQVGRAEPTEFADALGTIAPIAALLGIKFTDLTGTMAVLSRVNGNMAENATSLGQVMNTLLAPTDKTDKALASMGLSAQGLRDILADQGLNGVLTILAEKVGTNDEAMSEIFPNIRALRGVLNLTGQDANSVATALGKVENRTGALNEALKSVQEDAATKFDKAMAALKVTLIDLSNDVIPVVLEVVAGFVGAIKSLADWFMKLDKPMRETIVKALAFAAALGPILIIVGSLTSALGGGILAITKIGTVAGAAALKIATFVAAMATTAIQGFATAIFATGIPALQKLGVALIGLKVAAGPLLIIAAGIAAIAVAAQQGVPSIDALKEKLAELESDTGWGRNQEMIDFLKGKIAEMEAVQAEFLASQKKAFADLVAMWNGTGIPQAVGGVVDKIKSGLASGKFVVKDGALVMAEGIPEAIKETTPVVVEDTRTMVEKFGVTLGGVKKAAKTVGTEAMGELAEGIRSASQAPVDALDTLKQLMKDTLSPAKEQARLLGILTSKELAKGLKDGRPAVRAQAEYVKQLTLDQLAAIAPAGTKLGKKAMTLLAKAMRSKDPEIRAAATAIYNAAKKPIARLPGAAYDWGSAAGKKYAQGLRSAQAAVSEAARRLAAITSDYLKGYSPTKLGPMSQGGGLEGWGAKAGDLFSRGLRAHLPNLSAALGPMPSFAMGMPAMATVGAYPGRTDIRTRDGEAGDRGEIHYHYHVDAVGVIPVKNPFELSKAMQRVARITRPETAGLEK
jgi:TP901 family phage tail tape measure protein